MKRKALPVLNVEAITALANAATISPEDLRAHLRGRRPKVGRGQNALPAVAARYEALEKVLDVQRRVNDAAARENRLPWGALDILNAEEESRIRELLAANGGRGTWPDGWTGREPLATDPFEEGGQLNFLVEDEDLDSPSEAPPKPLGQTHLVGALDESDESPTLAINSSTEAV